MSFLEQLKADLKPLVQKPVTDVKVEFSPSRGLWTITAKTKVRTATCEHLGNLDKAAPTYERIVKYLAHELR